MVVNFKNLSTDLSGRVKIKNSGIIDVLSLTEAQVEINGTTIEFSVVYNRDFSFGLKPEPKNSDKLGDVINNKLNDKIFESIGNAVVQIENTYCISGLKDGAVIEINDRAHYVQTSGVSAFFNCLPALYYFGQAECEQGSVGIVSSVCFNREAFIKFYRFFYSSINLANILNIVKYSVQVKRQKKISSQKVLTSTFTKLYALSPEERDYQFKPIKVLGDRLLRYIQGKLPKRVYKKLVKKLKGYFNI